MGWLISPTEDAVYVYRVGQHPVIYDLADNSPETVLPVPEFAGDFKLTIGELFAWLVI